MWDLGPNFEAYRRSEGIKSLWAGWSLGSSLSGSSVLTPERSSDVAINEQLVGQLLGLDQFGFRKLFGNFFGLDLRLALLEFWRLSKFRMLGIPSLTSVHVRLTVSQFLTSGHREPHISRHPVDLDTCPVSMRLRQFSLGVLIAGLR
jgi:hypothetical protein